MKKFTFYAVSAFLLFQMLTALSASAQWTLVENFNSLTNGALHSQNSWTTGTGTGASNFTSGTTSDVAVAADPANASNKVLSISGTHRGAYKSMFTMPTSSSVYTVFYRMRIDNIDNLTAASGESSGFGGVTDTASPGFFSHYKVQNGVNPSFGTSACVNGNSQATSYFHCTSNGTIINKFLTSNHPVSDTWYSLWFVIDNNGFTDGGAAQYRVYIQGGAYTTPTLLQWNNTDIANNCDNLITELALRNSGSLSTTELSKIFFRTAANHASPLYFDDIYYATGTNTTNPTDWNLVDNFTGLTTGTLNSSGLWSHSGTEVVTDPAVGSNNVGAVNANTEFAAKSMASALTSSSSTFTVFLRARFENIDLISTSASETHGFFGITDKAFGTSPTGIQNGVAASFGFADYETQMGSIPSAGPIGVASAGQGSGQNCFDVRDGAGTNGVNGVYNNNAASNPPDQRLVPDVWYNFWIVADKSALTYTIYVQGGAYSEPTAISVYRGSSTSFRFRNNAALSEADIKFAVRCGANANAYFYFDDIYVTNGTSTSVPTGFSYTISEASANFRTNGNANFSSAANWQYYNGTSWVAAASAPSTGNGILVRSGHTVTQGTNFNVVEGKALIIENGGTYTVSSGNTLTLNANTQIATSPGAFMQIAGVFNGSGTANLNGQPVYILSNATGTGAIGAFTGTLSNATNVFVERYIPSGRKWRALCAPIINAPANTYQTLSYNWQNAQSQRGPSGAIIWNPNGGTGLYNGGFSPNFLTYNSSSNAWEGILNTGDGTGIINDGVGADGTNKIRGYMGFVTGPYNAAGSYISSGTAATTLTAIGTIHTGNVTYNLTSDNNNQFHFFGNPYPSPINFSLLGRTNINNLVYIWDARRGSLGGYRLWNGASWVGGAPSGSSYGSAPVIQSGQAFFVQTPNSGAASLAFEESDKVTTSTNVVFREQSNTHFISINLNKKVSGEYVDYDGTQADFVQGANAGVDNQDITKLANFSENIALVRNGIDLANEYRPVITSNDTLFIRIWKTAVADYQFVINDNMNLPPTFRAVLQDLYLGTEKELSLGQANLVNFNVTNDAASTGNRFRIVFRSNAVTPVVDLNGTKGFGIYPNPIAKGADLQLEFRNRPAGKYTVTIYSIAGVRMQQQMLRHNGGTAVQTLNLNNQLSTGNYLVELMNEKGEKEQVKISIQ